MCVRKGFIERQGTHCRSPKDRNFTEITAIKEKNKDIWGVFLQNENRGCCTMSGRKEKKNERKIKKRKTKGKENERKIK